MRKTLRLMLFVGASLSGLSLSMACSDSMAPSGGKKAETEGPTGGVNEASGSADAKQLAAFSASLYPLVKEHCAECHASVVSPNFAHKDAATAMKTINTAQLVTLASPAGSRLVKRLSEQAHNCWSECAEDAEEMAAAITAWADEAGDGGTDKEYVQLASVPISSAGQVVLKGGFDKTWVRAAAYADAVGDRFEALDDSSASQGRVMYRRADYTTLPDPKPEGGAYYYFEIPESDTEAYQLCFRVKTNIAITGEANPVNHGTRVYAQVNGKRYVGGVDLAQGIAPTGQAAQQVGDSYVWMPAFYAPDANNQQQPTATNLKPMKGSKAMNLYVYDTQPAIDLIALTGVASNCSASSAPNSGPVHGFAFDLTEALGQKATFTIQYRKSSDGLAQVFSRPTIELENPATKVHVEEIYVVINDQIDRQLNTFASVNADVIGGAVLSAADLIVPLGAATDKVGIHIGKISITP